MHKRQGKNAEILVLIRIHITKHVCKCEQVCVCVCVFLFLSKGDSGPLSVRVGHQPRLITRTTAALLHRRASSKSQFFTALTTPSRHLGDKKAISAGQVYALARLI